MARFKIAVLLSLMIGLAGLLISLNGCGSVSKGSSPPPTSGKINHVVVIFQENRTPDNLFHDPVLIGRGADIASSGKASTIVFPLPLDLVRPLLEGITPKSEAR